MKSSIGRLATAFGVIGTCVTTLVLSAGLLVQRSGSPASVADAVAPVLPAAEVQARAAEAAFAAQNWNEAERRTRLELAVSPVREDAWLRLARLDVARHGRLGPQGLDALSRSYDAVPYEHGSAAPRHRFVQLHMVELPPELRAQVEVENSTLRR